MVTLLAIYTLISSKKRLPVTGFYNVSWPINLITRVVILLFGTYLNTLHPINEYSENVLRKKDKLGFFLSLKIFERNACCASGNICC